MPNDKKRINTVFILLVLLISLGASASPTHAQEARFSTGDWWGTFIFTFKHEYDASSPELGLAVNTYKLVSYESPGSLAFSVDDKGNISDVTFRFPRIEYLMTSSQLVTYESLCKGYEAHGGSFARISTNPAVLLQRTMKDALFTAPISIYGGVPYMKYTPKGSCDRKKAVAALIEGTQWDLASMIAAPWVFQANSITDKKVSGTCSTEPWTVVNHKMTCVWQAFLLK